MSSLQDPVNVSRWIEDIRGFFQPPVCNKLMHQDQINVMFVGGPNQREDFHIEAGEELFYQLEGDMVLKVVEKGRHRDIVIKEGEVFLLPRAIPHSPQRFSDTVGLVIERLRRPEEFDTLRYYMERDGHLVAETLYEVTFHWQEGRNLMPEFFKSYYSSEEYRTKKPSPDAVPDPRALTVDSKRSLQDPFPLKEWIRENREKIDAVGKLPVFDTNNHQIQAYIYGKGETAECVDVAETWIWQLEGNSILKTEESSFNLAKDDSLLVPIGQRFKLIQKEGSLAFVCHQDPRKGQH